MNFKTILLTGSAVFAFSAICEAQEGLFGQPPANWGDVSSKVEPGTSEGAKKLSGDLGDLKNRLQKLEENQNLHASSAKSQFDKINNTLQSLQTQCDRLQSEMVAVRNGTQVTQASAKTPVEPSTVAKPESLMQDSIVKRLDDISASMQEMTKLNLQVQSNTRELNDLRKKYDALQLEVIQAQNDVGKLQQDMVRHSRNESASRYQPPSGGSRQSMAMPLPPESPVSPVTPRTDLGTLRLVNTYPATVTVVVDGQYYTVRSNESLNLNRTPGYFTYEVLGITGNTLRTINPAETLTVQIYPR